jgi:arylformamidase
MLLSCRWKQVADDLPAQLVPARCRISGLYDLEPCA